MADNRVHLFRLQIIIIDGGLLVLRNIIDQTLTAQGVTLSACLKNEKATIARLKSRGVITQVQHDILFPTGGQAPTTSQMDFTLIICLLRCLKCFGLNKKFDWNTEPISTDLTVEADICRLKDYRNEICHLPTTTGIQPHEFGTWWNDIEQILVRQSSPALNIQQAIADFKVCPLDLEEEKRLQEELKRWKDYEADVDRLNEEMKQVQTDVIEVKKDLKEVEAKFTGVEKQLKAIEKRQDAEKSNEGVSQIQTEEEKYQNRKKGK
ncbi:E3 ubiquitin-protein ligase DZIP3-like [Ruditapes philippinarum]|uniref:E3 ubiquitin-protein ligase DZIP3-like n=1 Tax=Ruditapes philippinarum TaxID=129788 RepID=UPI00295ADA72|nr:E3 ubiquitin-protein ligase DZIP3-like [Ruditapes philippinarum]